MPTYDYKCDVCGRVTEVFFRSLREVTDCWPCSQTECLLPLPSDVPVPKRCGGTMRKQIGTGVGLIFRGTGFHVTDYDKNGPKKPVQVEKE